MIDACRVEWDERRPVIKQACRRGDNPGRAALNEESLAQGRDGRGGRTGIAATTGAKWSKLLGACGRFFLVLLAVRHVRVFMGMELGRARHGIGNLIGVQIPCEQGCAQNGGDQQG